MVVLLLLAPLVAEVQFGTTVLSQIGGFLLQPPLYGCGALVVREVARRTGGGWPAIVLLGGVYAIVEEAVAEPTWLTPALFSHPIGVWGGVFTVYAAFNFGLHAVWSIGLPILLIEMLFPSRRYQPWLGRAGIAVCLVVYAATMTFAGLVFYGQPQVRLHPVQMAVFALIGVALAIVAVRWAHPAASNGRAAPRPWVVFLVVLVACALWFAFLVASDSGDRLPGYAAPLVLAAEVVVAAPVLGLLHCWTASAKWSDAHRVAVIAAAMIPDMLPGYQWLTKPQDIAFKAVVNVAMLAFLVVLAYHRRKGRVDVEG
ncbi:MAG: hypothetical protein ACRDQA_05670 [Nocardioidaceae bacterium]